MKNKIAVIALAFMMILSGCAKNTETESVENLAESSSVIIKAYSNEFREEFEQFVKGELPDFPKYFSSELKVEDIDKNYRYKIIDSYSNENAVYIKIEVDDEYFMYRFQMGTRGKIESYLKYEVEA